MGEGGREGGERKRGREERWDGVIREDGKEYCWVHKMPHSFKMRSVSWSGVVEAGSPLRYLAITPAT